MEPTFIKDIRQGMKDLTVTFIVLEVGNPTLLKENREVRTLKVADATACINLSLWDEPGHLLVSGDIVRITKGYANIWRNCLTLYAGKTGDIDKVGDFCMVFNEQLNMSEPNLTFENPPGPIVNIGINNGNINNLNNNGKMVRPPRPNLPASLPPAVAKTTPRFPSSEQSTVSNKQSSKLNSKPGRGGGIRNMVRPERR